MAHYLLEDPWPAVVVLGCVAFALLLAAMRRRQRGFLTAAGAAALLAVGVYALATLVTTDRETVERRTREVVAATAPLDLPVLRRLIDESAAVMLPNGVALPLSAPLTDELADAAGRYGVQDQSIASLYVQMRGPDTAEATLSVRTTQRGEAAYQPVNTQWRLTWRRPPNGDWRIVAVEWLKFEHQPPTAALWH